MTNKEQVAAVVVERFGTTVNRNQLIEINDEMQERFGIGVSFLQSHKVGRGIYDISSFVPDSSVVSAMDSPTSAPKSDEEIIADQRRRFRTLDRMAQGVTDQRVRAMIVAGPAGIGKSYTLEGILESAESEAKIQYTSVRGFVRPTGLFKLLWENREKNQVVLLDDADSVFADEVALNLLKAALDTSKRRIISWRSEKMFEDAEGEIIPNEFEYKGSIIFITNLNFETMLGNSKLGPHCAALISRSYYIDLNLASTREYMLRIKDVLNTTDMAHMIGLTAKQADQIVEFMEQNTNRLRELSLRMVKKLADIMLFTENYSDFTDVASVTCFKSR